MNGQVPPAVIAAVYPVSSIKKVESKRKKGRFAADPLWDDILRESLDTADADAPVLLKEQEQNSLPTVREARRHVMPQPDAAQEPEEMLLELRKIAGGDPEKLMGSHSYIFTEPVHPGKWVDSQG